MPISRTCAAVAALTALCALSGTARATDVDVQLHQKLFASDGLQTQQFGQNVAVSGDRALIGAGSFGSGIVLPYVFTYTRDNNGDWIPSGRITAPDLGVTDMFGFSLDLDGGIAVIGAQRFNNEVLFKSGAVYIYRLVGDTWVQELKLVPPQNSQTVGLGSAVAVSGNTVLAGSGNGKGVILDYIDGSWHETWIEADISDRLAVDGDTALFGAAVMVRDANGAWAQQAWLNAPNAPNVGPVAIDGNTVLVGDVTDSDNGPNAGAVWVFERAGTTWTRTGKLVASDGSTYANFGHSIDLDDNVAVIGISESSPCNCPYHGAAYVFTRDATNAWTESDKLAPTDAQYGDQFGFKVSLDADTIFISAFSLFQPGEAGAAYVYSLQRSDAGGHLCGAPAIDKGRDIGTFLWSNCDGSGDTFLRVSGGTSTSQLVYTGIIDSGVANFAPFKFEKNDSAGQVGAQGLFYDLRVAATGIDGLDLAIDGSACLTFDTPAFAPVFLGGHRIPYAGSAIDLENGGDCLTGGRQPLTAWFGQKGGVTINGSRIDLDIVDERWVNTVNSIPLGDLAAGNSIEVHWEFATSPYNAIWVFGLGTVESSANWRDVDYAFRIDNGQLRIYQNGNVLGGSPHAVAAGDTATIQASGTELRFLHNDALVYSLPFVDGWQTLYVDTAFKRGKGALSVYVE